MDFLFPIQTHTWPPGDIIYAQIHWVEESDSIDLKPLTWEETQLYLKRIAVMQRGVVDSQEEKRNACMIAHTETLTL